MGVSVVLVSKTLFKRSIFFLRLRSQGKCSSPTLGSRRWKMVSLLISLKLSHRSSLYHLLVLPLDVRKGILLVSLPHPHP